MWESTPGKITVATIVESGESVERNFQAHLLFALHRMYTINKKVQCLIYGDPDNESKAVLGWTQGDVLLRGATFWMPALWLKSVAGSIM